MMPAKTTWTLLGGAVGTALLGYISQTCPGWSWRELALVVGGAVWGAWNLHRDPPAPKG
jgi:hypothetical protein